MAERRPVRPGSDRPRSRRFRSVRARTTIGAVVVVAVALVVGAAAFLGILRFSLVDGVRQSAETTLDQAIARVEAEGPSAVDGYDDDTPVQVIGADGSVLAHGDDADPPAFPTDDESRVTHDGDRWLVVADDADLPTGGEATVVAGASLDDADSTSGVVAVLLAIGVPLLVALMAVVVHVVTGRALRPVERMRREVDAIGATRVQDRVAVPPTGDEIAGLATTMNRMLDRVDDAATAQRRFVSDAAHELRSPVASIRQHAAVAAAHPSAVSGPELAQVVTAESLRLQDLVDALLALSRLDERGIDQPRPVDLDDIALAEVARLRATDRVAAGTLRVDGSGIGPARVLGDERLLAQVLRNLVDNAVRHASDTVALGVRAEGDDAVLSVDDDGPGVPVAERERVFDRFVRLDEARSRDRGGSGLGLAIVRDTVVAHGGTVSVARSPLGGARFTVRIALGG